MDSPKSMSGTSVGSSPKVWTQLECSSAQRVATDDHQMTTAAADDDDDHHDCHQPMLTTGDDGCEESPHDEPMTGGFPTDTTVSMGAEEASVPAVHLHCLESGDGRPDYTSVMAVVNGERTQRPYCPSQESRQLHNHKERLRRSRMKCSCDALRSLVPGITDKTDKATVLEHTVAFLLHLSKCDGVKCSDYLPAIPPPMSARLLDLYPDLMTGEYQLYESSSTSLDMSSATNMTIDSSTVLEVHEQNGAKYVTTTDGYQYMIVENEDGSAITAVAHMQSAYAQQQPMDTNDTNTMATTAVTDETMPLNALPIKPEAAVRESHKCLQQVVDLLSEDKENIDPNAVKVPKKRGRKPKADKLAFASLVANRSADNAVVRQPRPKGRPRKVKPIDA